VKGPRTAVVRKEIREILRDRRAIVLSFVLPVFIYPVMFSFMSFLERRDEARVEADVYRVTATGDLGVLADDLRADERLELVRLDAGRDPREAVVDGTVQAWLDAPDGPPAPGKTVELDLAYHAARDDSREARDRIESVLDDALTRESSRRFRAAGGRGNLTDLLTVAEVDVATEEETGGARAGQLIPFLLIMTLFIGGGTLSTDLVAGEKERGTLETLYLAPIPRGAIAASKFVVVWGATTVTGILNLLSMLFCYRTGLIGDAATGAAGLTVSVGGVALAFVLIVPLAALVGGVLLGVSAMARSLREAQLYLLPAMLLAMLPGLLATGQHVPLTPFTALLPVANVALAIRDGLLGSVPAGLFLLVCVASIGWGAAVTRWTATILSREDTILGFDPEPFLSHTRAGRRRAALLGMAGTVFVFFYVGNLIQARALVPGLIVSLWALLPALGAGTVALAWSGGSLRDLLSLRSPPPGAVIGGALIGAGILVPIQHGLMAIQGKLLPVPPEFLEELGGAIGELSGLPAILLFAVSPGICEELVFRGAFLGLLRRVGSVRSAVLISAAFFGVIHLSVFRFLPTFTVGIAAALVVVRTGSILPAMALHAIYNGLAVSQDGMPPLVAGLMEGGVPGWAVSVSLLVLGGLLVRPRRRE